MPKLKDILQRLDTEGTTGTAPIVGTRHGPGQAHTLDVPLSALKRDIPIRVHGDVPAQEPGGHEPRGALLSRFTPPPGADYAPAP